MRSTSGVRIAILLCATAALSPGAGDTAAAQASAKAAVALPVFEVDPSWPRLPSKWVFGLVSGINVDSQDHIWVIHRPRTAKTEDKGRAAPAVVEFDAAGNFIQAWGGPSEGYEWPVSEHGITVDYKGFVWVAGQAVKPRFPQSDDMLLKFTKSGKFVMQIGHLDKSAGNTDTRNVRGAADVTVYPKTNEVFVADGYGNRRVIVFDADTGAFKRMWTAFGNPPTDDPPPAPQEEGPGSRVFGNVHSVRVSNDGLVYVSDRGNNRVQVFTVDGMYVTQVFVSRDKASRTRFYEQAIAARPGEMPFGRPLKVLYEELETIALNGTTASRMAFSPDPQQRFLYVIDRPKQQVVALDRKTLAILGPVFGRAGAKPGEFYVLHDIAVDSKGNIYTAEVNDNGARRAQKFVFKGVSPAK
jgi:DNA-binding beta-propeller fold protein YncE